MPAQSANKQFAKHLLQWFDHHGRKHLPWKKNNHPYPIWISEIMLQQTQVSTVIPYFERFIERFPDLDSLAAANVDEVLAHWSGLGYYARGRNLHKAAEQIREQHGGEFPGQIEDVLALPGIGRSTAAAILAQAHNQHHAILDGNVKRVLARLICLESYPGETRALKQLWTLAEALTPAKRVADYTQAIMDLGAMLCTRSRPACDECPVQNHCESFKGGRVSEFPKPRPKKNRPRKTAVFALVRDQNGRLMLTRRPPAGIWGGLWCLPEFDREQELFEWLQQSFGSDNSAPKKLEPIKHGFTHYELEIQPISITINADTGPRIAEDELNWCDPDHLSTLGLPAPFRRLLAGLSNPEE